MTIISRIYLINAVAFIFFSLSLKNVILVS